MNTFESLITGPVLSSEKAKELAKDFKSLLIKHSFSSLRIDVVSGHLAQLLTLQNIKLRKFKTHCRSCIITDAQVNEMATFIYELWRTEHNGEGSMPSSFDELPKLDKKPIYELVYAIPVAFKQLGYELYRPAEDAFLNEALAEQLARIIHARFSKHMIDETSTDVYQGMYLVSGNKETFDKEFDELPDDIKHANIDNTFHIPSKLLAIGCKMEPVADGVFPELLKLSDNEVEAMAMLEHDRWSWERRLNGWTYNEIRNNDLKHHNCLIPYDELPPHEQEKDRIMVRFIPALLVDIGYCAVKVSPELVNEISYIGQQNGYVFEAETQIRNLQNIITQQNDEIQSRFDDIFNKIDSIDELKKEINAFHKYLSKQYLHSSLQRLDTTNYLLKHIKGTFKSGKYLQNTFLPNTFELKEYFPDSFTLFKPKDIVSGDFYFFAKQNNTVLFTAADCTGHGISGSILSGICYNYLHEAVYEYQIDNPIDILNFVMPKLRKLLKHSDSLKNGSSEMELAICSINKSNNKLIVSSYGRPIYAFLNGEFTQLGKGAKTVETNMVNGFYSQEVKLQKGDAVYSFSDGYADQLGGIKGKKFMTKKFKELLGEIQHLEMHEQCQILNSEIEDWRKCEGKYNYEDTTITEDQTDDICIIGIRC